MSLNADGWVIYSTDMEMYIAKPSNVLRYWRDVKAEDLHIYTTEGSAKNAAKALADIARSGLDMPGLQIVAIDTASRTVISTTAFRGA